MAHEFHLKGCLKLSYNHMPCIHNMPDIHSCAYVDDKYFDFFPEAAGKFCVKQYGIITLDVQCRVCSVFLPSVGGRKKYTAEICNLSNAYLNIKEQL